MKYFDQIVGLRLYMALWVCLGHGLQLAGFLERSNPLLKVALNGHSAVLVFIIISGFVITNLILSKNESYPRYIIRRFFRLYPAYVVCCVLGFLLSGAWSDIVQQVPWQDMAGWQGYASLIFELESEAKGNFLPHFLWHSVMLHGIVPVEVLPRAAMTFLPAAWSISLEWQFYIIAPFIILALVRTSYLLGVVAASLVLLYLYKDGFFGTYQIGAFIIGSSPYFAIGIASRLVYGHLARVKFSPVLGALICTYGAYGLGQQNLPLVVWGTFFSFMVWHENSPVFGRIFMTFTTSKTIMICGEASYSLYLIHRPVQVVLGWIALQVWATSHWEMFTVQMIAVVIAVPISIWMYFYIEKPGIALGRMVAKRARGKPSIN